jgi:23S rRNA (cytosine1962-C5)-methyltransferase
MNRPDADRIEDEAANAVPEEGSASAAPTARAKAPRQGGSGGPAAVGPGEGWPLPARPLEPERELPVVEVRTAGNHPILYRKMVAGPVGALRPADGDLVRAIDRTGQTLGFGLWNGHSEIRLRLISRGPEAPGRPFWESRIERAVALRRETLELDQVTNAYRVVHAEADGLSGLVVDRFENVLSAEVFSLGIYQRAGAIMELLAARLGTTHVRVSVDERIAEAERFAGRPLASPGLPDRVTIQEHGVRFRVNARSGHKTGFFCDQRDNRRDLARFCRDRTVLDVCSYSGGFALHALLRGGACEATCIDLDEAAIAMARANANANQVRLHLVHADAFGYMRQMAANARSFGVLVLDPPKLITSRDEVAPAKRKYFDLNTLAIALVEPGGLLLSCSCSGLLAPADFLSLLRAAARRAGREAQLLALTGAAPDHPVSLDALEGAYLKAAWLLMGERGAGRENVD